jgi:alanine racemase
VEYLGVARVTEAFQLRNAGITLPILVLEVVPDENVHHCLEQDLELTISSVESVVRWDAIAERMRRKAKIHIKVDTGMGRLGIPYDRIAGCMESIAKLKWTELTAVYSHFATSDGSDPAFAHLQLDRFNSVLEALHRLRIEVPLRHMANSGAIISLPDSHFDMVRPGIMLYGYPPANPMKTREPLHPVMSLVSRVVLVKSVEAGTSISYGRQFVTPPRTSIATVSIGYGDGYSRLLTHKAEVLIRGKRFPVVGTICMDHLMVNIGNTKEVKEGDEVTLIGTNATESISCWDVAEKLGTIPYEVTSLITQRVSRIFLP